MSFDLKWFTTLPGIFITVGVLLLIVALVILIVSKKKSKKEKKAMEDNASLQPDLNNVIRNSDSTQTNEQIGASIVTPQVVVTPMAAQAGPEVSMGQPMPEMVGSAPIGPTGPEMVAPAPMGPVAPEMAAPAPMSPAGPEMAAPAPMSPAGPEMAIPAMPEVAPASPVGEPVIYGGVNPTSTVTDVNVNNNQTHQIYGGADPLENTQPLPAVQTIQAVQPVAPVPTPVMTAPEVTTAPMQQ